MEPAAVDAAWLTAALAEAFDTPRRVLAWSARSIGTGQVGENVRFELTWDGDVRDTLPASVVGKFPSASAVSRATAVRLGSYAKEIGFYRDLLPSVSIRTPHVHHIEWDPSTHDFVLLMEDVRPVEVGDQLIGCRVDWARVAVDEVVGLHAPTWGRTGEWSDLDWLETDPGAGRAVMVQLFELLTPGFVRRFTGRLSCDDLALASALAARYERWSELVGEWVAGRGARCIVHGDYRLDNMLAGEPPGSPALTVVDWQTVGVGTGISDVAYFVGAGLLPADRAEHERSLVDRYAAAMRAAGVGLSNTNAWDGYVLGSVTGLYMAVLASQIVEQTDRGDEMFAVMAERHLYQIRGVGLPDLVGCA